MSLAHNYRLRPDLIIQPQDASSGTWVVKDPVSLRFFLFGGDEHFILQRLDGQKSAAEILDDFARDRAPKRMTLDRLQAFLSSLYRNGLASSDAPGQARLLLEREAEQRWRESLLSWTNLLAIRLPGFNPDLLLDGLYVLVRRCFTWTFLAICVTLFFVAGGIAISEWDALRVQWPRWEEFVNGRNLIWLGVALVTTKCLHELAHALTCKHFGGRCQEMGLILLVFTPCLYCNVTDAWMLRGRWQRIAISAAGMVMEIFLASLATIIWRFSEPGTLNSICFNVMLICGISTLLFNGNPLLKYDGYYILSDLVRMPNLWQESRIQLYGVLSKWFLGGAGPSEVPHSERQFLLIYAIASIIYRICLTLGILLFLYRILHPRGFDLIVLIVAGSILAQSVASWSGTVGRWWKDPTRLRRVRKGGLFVLTAVVSVAMVALFFVTFPCSVTAPAVLQPVGATRVYVTAPGVLDEVVNKGDIVKSGDVLAVLENPELRNQQLAVASDLSRAEARVKTLQARLNDDTEAAAQLLIAQEILSDLTEQMRLRDQELKSLILRAPAGGMVITPPKVEPQSINERELPTWSGTPLDPENRGCYLDRGTLLCLLGDPQQFEAVVLVDETDVSYVRVGQKTRLKLEYAKATMITGRVVEIAEINAETAPAELVSQHDIAVRQSGPQAIKPIRTLYQVRVALDVTESPLTVGARGMMRIQVEPQTIAQRITRWLSRTLSIEPKS